MNFQLSQRQQEPQLGSEQDSVRTDQQSEFSLLNLLQIARTRWRLIAGTVFIVSALTIITLFQLTPQYTSSAVVMLDQRKNNVADLNAVLSGLPTDPSSIENQVQILQSRNLALRVINRLSLDRDPEFNGKGPGWFQLFAVMMPSSWFGSNLRPPSADLGADDENAVIKRFEEHLNVNPIALSTAITVGFESADPAKAALVTNTVADEYVEDQLNAKFEATQKATQWLADRIQKLSRQVQGAEAAVQQYKADNNITETADGGSIVDQQMASVSGQLVLAKSDLAEKEANYGRVSSLVKSGRAADVSQVVSSPLIATLRAQETTLGQQEADLSTQFGPRHPKILELESEKKNLQAKIGEEVQRVVQTVASDAAVAQANVNSLQASLAQLEAKSQDQSKASVRLKALEAAAASDRLMYEAYLGRLKEAQGQEGIQTPDARIISAATMPDAPSFPKKTLITAVVVPISIFLGFILAFAAERLDAGFRTSAQVEAMLGVPVLGVIPEINEFGPAERHDAGSRVIDKPTSSFAEAIRGLQIGLSLSHVDAAPKVIVVTSSVPGEGKTTVAVSLARLAALSGKKVVLVDCDLRRPTLHKALSLTGMEHDISDALSGSAPLDRCVTKDPRTDAVVLPCLSTPPSPADMLLSNSMENLVRKLRMVFDVVIIDSAPVLPVNDTKILSRLCDAVLFVIHWEKTPRDAAINAIRGLENAKAQIAGIALARADTTRFQHYNYGYQNYNAYNKYYSD